MDTDRRIRLWSLVVDHAKGGPVAVEHVCAAVIEASEVDGAAVVVRLAATPRETLYATDRSTVELEELSLTLGEGPFVDALTSGLVLVGDLEAPRHLDRWPTFVPAAVRAGARAAFALPLQVGGIRLGTLDLHRRRSGKIAPDQLADALGLADTISTLLLDTTQRSWPDESGRGPDLGPHHPEVHQATGMLIVQLGVTAAVALIRLRAYAYAQDRRLSDVARDVVDRRLRFLPESADD